MSAVKKLSIDENSYEQTILQFLYQGSFDRAVTMILRGLAELEGDEKFTCYGDEIFGYLVKATGDYVSAQEIFSMFKEDLWKGICTYKPTHTLRSWLYCVARNARNRYYTRDRYREVIPLTTNKAAGLYVSSNSSAVHQAEQKNKLLQVMYSHLTPDERDLLIFRVDREMAWDEIADSLGIESAAARKRYERLKRKIASIIEKLRQDPNLNSV